MDWYKFELETQPSAGDQLNVTASTEKRNLALQLQIFQDANNDNDPELINNTGDLETLNAGTPYWVRVASVGGVTTNYQLTFSLASTRDRAEDNDSVGQAYFIEHIHSVTAVEGLTVDSADEDWFRFILSANATQNDEIILASLSSASQLSMEVYDSSGNALMTPLFVQVNGANEAALSLQELDAGEYTLRVSLDGGPAARYELRPVIGQAVPAPSLFVGNGIQFNGVNDGLVLPSTILDGLSSFTVSFWHFGQGTDFDAVLSGANADNANELEIVFVSSTEFALGIQNRIVRWDIPDTNDDRWRHFSVVVDAVAGQATLYVDGVSFGSQVLEINPLQIDAGGLILGQEQDSVGGNFDPAQALSGVIDEFTVWTATRSVEEIRQDMFDQPSQNTPDLVVYYLFDGNTLDMSGQGNHVSRLLGSPGPIYVTDFMVDSAPTNNLTEGTAFVLPPITRISPINDQVLSSSRSDAWYTFTLLETGQRGQGFVLRSDEIGVALTAELRDTIGRVLLSVNTKNRTDVVLSLEDLQEGTYFIRVTGPQPENTPGQIQRLIVSNGATGNFTISVSGQTTAEIPATATAAEIQTVLLNLPNVKDDQVIVSGGALGQDPVLIHWLSEVPSTVNMKPVEGGPTAFNGTLQVFDASFDNEEEPVSYPVSYGLASTVGVVNKLVDDRTGGIEANMSASPNLNRRDVILGGAGNDRLSGGSAEDWIFGNSGNDVLTGGPDLQASDLIYGGEGDDLFQITTDSLPINPATGQPGDPALSDLFDGGPGDDRVIYLGGDVDGEGDSIRDFVALGYDRFLHRHRITSLVWDTGNDQFVRDENGVYEQTFSFFQARDVEGTIIQTGDGVDVVHADPGYILNNQSWGIARGDVETRALAFRSLEIHGGDDKDFLYGGASDDVIFGGIGRDFISGGEGDDRIFGGAGNDELAGNSRSFSELPQGTPDSPLTLPFDPLLNEDYPVGSVFATPLSDLRPVPTGIGIGEADIAEFIIDDTNTDYFESGEGWEDDPALLGFGGSARRTATIGDNALWSFDNLLRGVYEIFVTWPEDSANASSVMYRVFEGESSVPVMIFTVDQRVAPADNGQWRQLGEINSETGQIRIEATSGSGGFLVADAVRLTRNPVQDSFALEGLDDDDQLARILELGDISGDGIADYLVSGATGGHVFFGPINPSRLFRVDTAQDLDDGVNDLILRGNNWTVDVQFDDQTELERAESLYRVSGRSELTVDPGLGRPAQSMGDISGDGISDLIFYREAGVGIEVIVIFGPNLDAGDQPLPRVLDQAALDSQNWNFVTIPVIHDAPLDDFQVLVLNWTDKFDNGTPHDDVAVLFNQTINLSEIPNNPPVIGQIFSGADLSTPTTLFADITDRQLVLDQFALPPVLNFRPEQSVRTDLQVAVADDVNRDGFDDLLIGDQRFIDVDPSQTLGLPDQPNYGRAYLLLGRSNPADMFLGAKANNQAVASETTADFIWQDFGLGAGVAGLGDVNQDGFADFSLARTRESSTDTGSLFLIGGNNNFVLDSQTIYADPSVNNLGPNLLAEFTQIIPDFPESTDPLRPFMAHGVLQITAGDFDEDTKIDLAIGESLRFVSQDPNEDLSTVGADALLGWTYVFWAAGAVPLGSPVALTLSDAPVVIVGEQFGDGFGHLPQIPNLDINGDGFDDLIIGSPGAEVFTAVPNLAEPDEEAGRLYPLYGGPRSVNLPLTSTRPLTNREVPGSGLYVVDPPTGQPYTALDQLLATGVNEFSEPVDGNLIQPIEGTWTVNPTFERLDVYPPAAGGDAIGLVSLDAELTPHFQLQTSARSNLGVASNAYLVFNYINSTNFHFAGFDVATQKWQLGRRTASGWQVDDSVPDTVLPLTSYAMEVEVDVGLVTFSANGHVLQHDYVTFLNSGEVGLATDNSTSQFDDLFLSDLDRWFHFATLGDGQIGNQIRLLMRDLDTNARSTSRPARPTLHTSSNVSVNPGDSAVLNQDLLESVSGTFVVDVDGTVTQELASSPSNPLEVGGPAGDIRVSLLEFDLSRFLSYVEQPEGIADATLHLSYQKEDGGFGRGDLRVFLLDGEADMRVQGTDVNSDAIRFESLLHRFLASDANQGVIPLDLTQQVQEALSTGKTKITLRLETTAENGTPFIAPLKIGIPEEAGSQTRLEITTARRAGVVADVISAEGTLLAKGQAIVDMRQFEAGEFLIRVYDPFQDEEHSLFDPVYRRPGQLDFVVEIAPPKVGDADPPSDFDEIWGEVGNDLIVGNGYTDRIFGGDGSDDFTENESVEVRDVTFVVPNVPFDVVPVAPALGEESTEVARPQNFEIPFDDPNLELLIANALDLTITGSAGTLPKRPLLATDLTRLVELDASASQLNDLQLVGSTDLLGIDFNSNSALYDIDKTTGAASNPRSTGISGVIDIAFGQHSIIYAVSNGVPTPADFGALYTINRTTGVASQVGLLGFEVGEGDLDFDPRTGTLFAVFGKDSQTNQKQFIRIDTQTGQGTIIADDIGYEASGLAFNASGTLYALDDSNDRLLIINKSDGSIVQSTPLSTPVASLVGMDFDPIDGTLYVADGEAQPNGLLYTVNVSNGQMALVGELTGVNNKLSGLEFQPIDTVAKDLTGIEYATNLEYLSLAGNGVFDLRELPPGIRLRREAQGQLGLGRLRMLDLDANPVGVIDDLESIRTLEFLSLDGRLQESKVIPDNGAAEDIFGQDVAVAGNTMVVGARWKDVSATDDGAAYIYERTPAGWQQVAQLSITDDVENGSFFGETVDISADGTTVVVGALALNAPGTDSGAVYVFRKTDIGWRQVQQLTANDAEDFDLFGSSVAINGEYIIVGAGHDDDKGMSSGAAYIFRDTGSGWEQVAKLTASDGAANHSLGNWEGVDIYGNTAIASAQFNGAGAEYVFRDAGNGWQQNAKLTQAHICRSIS